MVTVNGKNMTMPEAMRLIAKICNGKRMLHRYVGRVNPEYKGQPCRLVQTWRGKAIHNVLIEFEDGKQMVCPMRGNVVKRKGGEKWLKQYVQ